MVLLKKKMKIILQDLGKKYNRQWIFRHLNCEIGEGSKIAVTGHNGSGKSTLLKVIGGYVTPSEGKVNLQGDFDKKHPQTDFAIVAPYLNLLEEFTLNEHLNFHAKFKTQLISNQEIIGFCGLSGNEDKQVSDFSSGMKQRLRLSLAFFYKYKIILLDEPTSNLDDKGVEWYRQLTADHANDRSLIIASNQKAEYGSCKTIMNIEDYK